MTAAFRNLPAVELLVQLALERQNGDPLPRDLLVDSARAELAAARQSIAGGNACPPAEALLAAVLVRARAAAGPTLLPLINATGVIIQTNLGRAPLSPAALQAMHAVGAGYSNLEYDLAAGARGSRYDHLAALLCRLTGAEAALAVNNNAAAIYLALSALAPGREVVISRGQAVEIGGGFRIPDVLRQSGATLVEVGTTNRTYAHDYAAAIGERTALLMRVHTSNFQLVGFVHAAGLAELAELAHARGIHLLDDLGSGTLLPTARYGLAPEPTVQASVAAGADLVTFSGDKLLGGPQAGLIVGRAALVAQLRKHPLARALRVDKTTLAGLEATLLAYLHGRAERELPVWRMIAADRAVVQARAEQLAAAIGAGAAVQACTSTIGGGSLPGATLPSAAVALRSAAPDDLARRLRMGRPPVVGRIADDRLLLDVRTVLEEQQGALVECVRAAMT
ncbi:MAG: L-seryl-tRNA(Sec) selenium transferase [Kouleothrix sp.]|jgi:L-seryl-tRNA(Ser) seleniumtransferase|nr:L-seryl-tRNA(Sec) selenium transferase [Kouleothrix sp.]